MLLGGLQGHTTGRPGGWEGCRAILQGIVVAGSAAGLYNRALWWLVGLQGHTTGHDGSWKGCTAILNGHRGGWEGCRAYYRAPW